MLMLCVMFFFFFSSRRRHTRCSRDWSSDVCSSDLRRRRGRGVWGDADLHTLRDRTDRGNGRDELLSGWLRKKEPSGLLGSLGCVVVHESTHVLNPPDGAGIFTFAITRSTNPNSGANRVSSASSRSSLRSRSAVCRHSAHCARWTSRTAGRDRKSVV